MAAVWFGRWNLAESAVLQQNTEEFYSPKGKSSSPRERWIRLERKAAKVFQLLYVQNFTFISRSICFLISICMLLMFSIIILVKREVLSQYLIFCIIKVRINLCDASFNYFRDTIWLVQYKFMWRA